MRSLVMLLVPALGAVVAAGAAAAAPADFASRVYRPTERGLRSIQFDVSPPSFAVQRRFQGFRVRYAFEAPDGANPREAVRASEEFPDLAPAAASIARNFAWLSLVAGPQWLADAAANSGVAPNEKGGVFDLSLNAKADSASNVPAESYALRFGTGLGLAEPPEPPGLAFRMVPTDDELRAAGVDLDAEKKRREEMDGANAEKGRAYDGPFGGAFGWVYAEAPRTDGVYVKRSEIEGVAPARVVGYEIADGKAIRARIAPEDGARLRDVTSRNTGRKIAVLSGGALVAAPVIRDPIGEEVEITDPAPGAMEALIAKFVPRAPASAGGADAPLLLHRVESPKLGTIDIEYDAAPGGLFVVKRLTVHHPASGLGRYSIDLLDRRVNEPVDARLFATE